MGEKTKRTRKPPPARIDWLIGRVLESSRAVVADGVRQVSESEELREKSCLLLVDSTDPVAQAFYLLCKRVGLRGPDQLTPNVITTLRKPFRAVMGVSLNLYATAEHDEPPLLAGEVRGVVLTLGTLTVVRLGPDAAPRHASPTYRPLQPDVLVAAVACWRNDRPEGLKTHAVFQTRAQGERFKQQYLANIGQMTASPPTPSEVEEELLQFKPKYWDKEVPLEVQTRVYAQVAWLEMMKLMPDDDFNGTVFTLGCEWDLLEQASELARRLGGPTDDLS